MLVLRIYINEEESEIWDADEFIDKGSPIDLIDSLQVYFEHHSRHAQSCDLDLRRCQKINTVICWRSGLKLRPTR